MKKDHQRYSERWGEDLDFKEQKSELGSEEGVPRFPVWAIGGHRAEVTGFFWFCFFVFWCVTALCSGRVWTGRASSDLLVGEFTGPVGWIRSSPRKLWSKPDTS